jgi:DNA-binding Lrp family transcriptional regulator
MSDVIRHLTSFKSAEALQTLLVVRAMADEKGVVPHDIAVIAETLGITPTTLRKRLKELDGYVKVRAGRITTFPLDGKAIMHAFYKWDDQRGESTIVAPAEVMSRWSERYKTRYGVAYSFGGTSRFFAAKAIAAKFAAQYGENALAVIDAIIDNYDALWKTGDFPRPTFGQLSWIGEKAASLVKMRQTCDTTSDDVGYDTLDGV